MRYKHLKIHNIASITDAEINFENEPLTDESLILICGETGAGKTTILDSICLALFATTPRMNAAKKEDYNDKMKTDDVRQVLRKGESECFAELAFEGMNNKQYTARFEYKPSKRAKETKAKHSLTNETDNITLEKIIEIKEEITTNAVGCNLENFCRTNMLAQGEFSRFLDGKEEEKAEVLEQLTGTEIYSQLGQKIFTTWSEKNNKVNEENQQLSGQQQGLLSPEVRTELSDKLATSNSRILALETEKKDHDAKAYWLKQLQNIEQDKLQAEKDLNSALAAMSTAEYAEEAKLIADLATAQEENALANIADLALHKNKWQELQKEEGKQQQSAQQIANVLHAHSLELDRKKDQLLGLSKQLEAIPALRKKMLENADVVCSNIDNMFNNSSEEVSHKLKAQIFAKKENEFQQKIDKLQAEIVRDGKEAEFLESGLKLAQSALEFLHPERVNQQVNDLQMLAGEMTNLQTKLDRLNETSEAKNTSEKDLRDSNNLLPELVRQKHEAEQELKSAKYVYDHVQLSTNQYAQHLRHEVKVGDICPVCGKKVEEEISEELFESLLQKPKEEYDKAQQNYGDACARLKSAEEITQRLTKELDAKTKAWDKALTEFNQQQESLKAKALAMGEIVADWDTTAAIGTYKETLERKLEQQKANQEEVAKKTEEVKTLQKKINNINSLLNNGKEALYKQKTELTKCKSEQTKELELAENARKTAENFRNKTTQLLGTDEWLQNLGEQDDFTSQLRQDATAYNADNDRMADLVQKIKLTEQENDAAIQIFGALKPNIPNWELETGGAAQTVLNLTAYVNDSVNHIEKWLHECKAQQTTIDEKEGSVNAFLKEHDHFTSEYLQKLLERKNDIKQLADQHKRIVDQVSDAKSKLEAFAKQTNDLLQKKPVFTEEEEGREVDFFENKSALLAADIKTCTDESATCRTKLEADKEQRATIAAKLAAIEELKAELAPWEELKRIFGDAQGKTFKKIAQNYILSSLLVAANRHLKQFAPRFTLIANPGQLTILALDAENLNEPLSSTSLSGGQKFMVSLALALGLAEMCGGVNTGADILFIDEGFGSLDDERLDSVMNCLEKLHQNSQRKVAIISHVERLRAQIPTHIEVEALPGTTASSHIHITSTLQNV